MATRMGLEPTTSSVTGWRTNRLYYRATCVPHTCDAVYYSEPVRKSQQLFLKKAKKIFFKKFGKRVDKTSFFVYPNGALTRAHRTNGIKGYSSVGRAAVSKTACRGFESFCPCQNGGENNRFPPPFFCKNPAGNAAGIFVCQKMLCPLLRCFDGLSVLYCVHTAQPERRDERCRAE